MFAVCSYLEIINKNVIVDGFIVEECGDYSTELSDYCIVCREHRKATVFEWAKMNMGIFYNQFEKQFSINPQKAMKFVASNGKISSFTEEYVMSCGGVEKFKELYCVPTQELAQNKTSLQEIELSTDGIEEDTSGVIVTEVPASPVPEVAAPEEIDSFSAFETTEVEPSVDEAPAQSIYQENEFAESYVPEFSVTAYDEPVHEPSAPVYDEPLQESVQEPALPPEAALFTNDGTFKGFREGQVISILQQLRDLDKRITLDTLNPDDILNAKEIEGAAELLDSVAPSIFKAFIMDELKHVVTEADYIRVSALLNNFSSFLATVNN